MDVIRRRTLLATGAALGLSGCLDDLTGSGNPGEDNDGHDDDPDDIGHDVFQIGPSQAQPLWATVEGATGFITLIEDEYDDIWMVENLDERDDLQSWLDETDLEESSIVYIETAGPNTCYNELGVSHISIENGEIVGRAEAIDTSADNESCGHAETHPSAFVRISSDDLPDTATFTVVDGWEDSSEVTTDGRYADPAGLPGHVRPDGDPGKREEFSCDDEDFQRLESPTADEVSLGEAYNDEELMFAMRVHATQTVKAGGKEGSSPRVGRGDEVRVTMHNVSTNVQHTGNRHKWNLQVLTMDDWQDVRGTTGDEWLGYDNVALRQSPGEGFEWTLEMTEAGVLQGHVHEDKLEVCPDLRPGRYRFVYNSIVSGDPLAVEFDYEG